MPVHLSFSRRHWLQTAAGFSLSTWLRGAGQAEASLKTPVSMGTYAMPGFTLTEAVKLVANTGFDSIEIAAMPGYHGAPDQLSKAQRQEAKKQIAGAGLRLGALMGMPGPNAAKKVENDDWVKRLIELAQDLNPDSPPMIQTILGSGEWEDKRTLFRDTLGPWVEMAAAAGVKLAIKPHRSQAMTLPGQAIWLIGQLNAVGKLGIVFDASHYAFRDQDMAALVAEALPYTSYLVMKDAVQRNGEVRFELPGAVATIPHAEILQQFVEGGYRGEVCAEVSSHLSKAKGYDPVQVTRQCHTGLRRIVVQSEEKGFTPMFNGRDLEGWDGKPGCWKVRDGEIWCTGDAKEKNWLIWRGGDPADFTLRLEFRWDQGNSGVQVRSDDLGDWQVFGAQVEVAEREKMGMWHHSLLDKAHPKKETRHQLALAGQEAVLDQAGVKSVKQIAEAAEVQGHYEEHAWNTLEVIARGSKLVQRINGVVFAVVTDEDAEMSRRKGWIALQDHGKGCQVAFRHLRLKVG